MAAQDGLRDVVLHQGEAAMPPADMQFYHSEHDTTDYSAGTISNDREGARHRTAGRAGQFLERRGFGWLLDTEEEEGTDKPLL